MVTHDKEYDELRGEGGRDLHSRGEEDAGHRSHLDNTAPSVCEGRGPGPGKNRRSQAAVL